jgi:uncharacterized protein (DUF1800 family)
MAKVINRRDFLQLSGMSAALAALAACDPMQAIPTSTPYFDDAAQVKPPADVLHLLRRTTFGPTAAEFARAKGMGTEAWLEEQLDPKGLDIAHVEDRLEQLETYGLAPTELTELDNNGLVARELATAALIHQIFSPRQLFETMVDFWSNHFNIFAYAPPELFLKAKDDSEVTRAHALGSFPDLLRASAHSPAMLVYLDNAQSQYPEPNENYARELMELHTLGVDGGYSHDDVVTVARAFTGWTVGGLRRRQDRAGEFVYLSNWHDHGDKTLFGETLPGGEGDADRVLDMLAEHPATARHIAYKLCVRFVSDSPPGTIVDAVSATYADSNGSIPEMLRTIFNSPEFSSSAGLKLKRPLDFAISAIRVIGADGELERVLRLFLELLGQFPYGWRAPDGYPEVAAAWSNTNQSLYRWNMAIMLASGAIRQISTEITSLFENVDDPQLLDDLAVHLLGSPIPENAKTIIDGFASSLQGNPLPQGLSLPSLVSGLLLASPYFQIR